MSEFREKTPQELCLEISRLLSLLATERDAFAKKETELMADRDRLRAKLIETSRFVQLQDCERAELKTEIDRLKAEQEGILARDAAALAIVCREHNRWKAKAELYIRKLEQIRALPMRITKCSCFNIANKVLRKIEQEGKSYVPWRI